MRTMALMIEGDPKDPVALAKACEDAKKKALSELSPNMPASVREKVEAAIDRAISDMRSQRPEIAVMTGVIRAVEECTTMLPDLPKALMELAVQMSRDGDAGAHVFKLGAICSDIETALGLLEASARGLRSILTCPCHEHEEQKPEPAAAQA